MWCSNNNSVYSMCITSVLLGKTAKYACPVYLLAAYDLCQSHTSCVIDVVVNTETVVDIIVLVTVARLRVDIAPVRHWSAVLAACDIALVRTTN